MRAIRLAYACAVGFGLLLAFVTSIIAFGYLIKFIAVIAAVLGILAVIGLIVYAFIYEFVLKKGKPPK